MKRLDHIDCAILNLLQADGKLTNKELAARLELTVTPIYERVKRLEREGYIQKYVALVAPNLVGKSLMVLCSVSLRQHRQDLLNDFQDWVSSLPQVLECYHLTGDYDYLLKIRVKDIQAYQSFLLNQLSVLENIARVQSSFVMGEVKDTTHLNVDMQYL